MSETKIQETFSLTLARLPADTPIQFVYQIGNFYHYATYCCDELDPHVGMIMSTVPLKTGCGVTPPPIGTSGPQPSSVVTGATLQEERLIAGPPAYVYHYDGAPTSTTEPAVNPVTTIVQSTRTIYDFAVYPLTLSPDAYTLVSKLAGKPFHASRVSHAELYSDSSNIEPIAMRYMTFYEAKVEATETIYIHDARQLPSGNIAWAKIKLSTGYMENILIEWN